MFFKNTLLPFLLEFFLTFLSDVTGKLVLKTEQLSLRQGGKKARSNSVSQNCTILLKNKARKSKTKTRFSFDG